MKVKINLTSWIWSVDRLHGRCHAAAPHGIYCLRLLLLSETVRCATAQPGLEASQGPYVIPSNFNPTTAFIVVVFICAFFFMAFFSFYFRQCAEARSSVREGAVGSSWTVGTGEGRFKRGGLDREAIEAFPIFLYSSVKDLKIGKGGLECAVCLNEFEDDQTLRVLPKCNHAFHPECIDAWLTSHTTCPVCRSDLALGSGDLSGDSPDSSDSSPQASRPELTDSRTQVSINIHEDGIEGLQIVESVSTSENPRRNRPPAARFAGNFHRSHSTGHSLVQPLEDWDRYTVIFPDEVRKQLVICADLSRTVSFGRQSSSLDRPVGLSDRWVLSMAPPFLSREGSVRPPKVGGEGNVTAIEGSCKTFVTSVGTPVEFLAVKPEGDERSLSRTAI
ncbi:E3 ubiquitin-protein ligase ATL31-like [Malania oleifera]|uniref:E3 ubiquitin-protein ligase ATL31-like n=1 Tax=Malania oleifera TaxID=397392 RepID=UPI0025AE9B2E|nr:E3 ubiquitin-protein ligase ATL31-like [Malania oleifera]